MPFDKKPAAPDFCLKAALEAEFPAKGDLGRLIPQVPDIQRLLAQSVPTSGDWPGPCQALPPQTSSISTPFRADRLQPLALHLAHGERLPNDGRTANGSGISAEPRGGAPDASQPSSAARQTQQTEHLARGGLPPHRLEAFDHVIPRDAYARQRNPRWNRSSEQAKDYGLS